MKKQHLALGVGTVLSLMGLMAWIYQIKSGLAVTNLNNLFSWGLYMAGFEFFIGLASGGMLIYAIYYIWDIEALETSAKIGVISSLAAVIAAGIAILTDLGQPFHVFWMLLTPNVTSPLFWDLVVLTGYLLICVLAVVFLFMGKCSKQQHKMLAYVTLPYLAILNGVTTLLFAVQNTRLWWHSALLPIDSIVLAVAVGSSFVMLLMQLLNSEKSAIVGATGYNIISRISALALVLHFVFTVLELSTLAWSGSSESRELLYLLFNEYGALYITEQILFFTALVGYALFRNYNTLLSTILNMSAIVALLIHRLMMTLPAFNMLPLTIQVGTVKPTFWAYPIAFGIYQEGQDIFLTAWDYLPTMVECAVAILPLGVLIFIFAIFATRLQKNEGRNFSE